MHVAINGWFVGQPTTGHGQYLHHLLTVLPRQATDVHFSLLLPSPLADQPGQWQQHVAGVEVIVQQLPPWPKPLAKLWWEQVSVPWLAQKRRADVLWAPYWASPLWQPMPVVVTIHDLIPALLPAYRGGWQQRLYTQLVGYTARRAASVITVSQASARDLTHHLGIPPERIQVVYHGPNQEGELHGSADHLAAVRQKYQLPARFFLYLGGFDVRKNVQTTIHAYQRYLAQGGDPNIHLVLAGKLPAHDTPFTPDPRKIAQAAGVAHQLHCCGWVDEADKPALYALSTAFFFPSLYEGFGMMVLEAMRAGAPVVTSQSVGQ